MHSKIERVIDTGGLSWRSMVSIKNNDLAITGNYPGQIKALQCGEGFFLFKLKIFISQHL